MKKNAFATLLKDIIIALVAWFIGYGLLKSGFGMEAEAARYVAIYASFIPFGWRWATKLITAVSLKGLGYKLLISLCLGFIAIFVVFGGDLIKCIAQLFTSGKRAKAVS